MQQRKIGLEYEFLAVQKENGEAVTRDIMKAIWRDWSEQPHVILYTDPATRQPVGVIYRQKDGQEVIVNTDAGIDVVEFGFLPFTMLKDCEQNMRGILKEFLAVAARHGAVLLSYGMQPKTPSFFPDLKTEKIWYRGFLRFEGLAMRHSFAHNIAAHQPCIDVTYDELIPALNILNGLSGVVIALFANSGWGELRAQCCHEEREHRWNQWSEGSGERVAFSGIPRAPFNNLVDYLKLNWSIPVRAVHRGGSLLSIWPAPTIHAYLHGKEFPALDLATQETTVVRPTMEDVNMLAQYLWIQARAKFIFDESLPLADFLRAYDRGTVDDLARAHLTKLYVETRNIACQSWREVMAAPAFLLGLIENKDEALRMVESKSWRFWRALREKTLKKSMQVDGVIPLAQQIVEIAQKGLQARGKGEEQYLAPLFDRIERRESPAMRAAAALEARNAQPFLAQEMIVVE